MLLLMEQLILIYQSIKILVMCAHMIQIHFQECSILSWQNNKKNSFPYYWFPNYNNYICWPCTRVLILYIRRKSFIFKIRRLSLINQIDNYFSSYAFAINKTFSLHQFERILSKAILLRINHLRAKTRFSTVDQHTYLFSHYI